jgi:hypothetical protein
MAPKTAADIQKAETACRRNWVAAYIAYNSRLDGSKVGKLLDIEKYPYLPSKALYKPGNYRFNSIVTSELDLQATEEEPAWVSIFNISDEAIKDNPDVRKASIRDLRATSTQLVWLEQEQRRKWYQCAKEVDAFVDCWICIKCGACWTKKGNCKAHTCSRKHQAPLTDITAQARH